jgi:hypothetical protein
VVTITTAGNAAMCPTGKFALGGGGATTATGSALSTSAPVLDTDGRATGWTVQQTSGTSDGLTAYVICADAGGTTPPSVQALAPNNLAAIVGDFDAGGQQNDARLSFTAPSGNTIDSYSVQRSFLGSAITASSTNCTLGAAAPSGNDGSGSPAGGTFTTAGTVTASAGASATFTDGNLATGGYCYRVRTQHPTSGAPSFSNYAPANIAAAGPLLIALQGFANANDAANQVSAAVPGTGQHTFTFRASALTGTLSFAITPSGNGTQNADGTYGFCDFDGNRKADGPGGGSTFFTAVNGAAILQAPVIRHIAIPADGNLNVTIDTATRNQRVRVIAWQDLNDDGQVDLAAPGDPNCDAFTPYDPTVDGRIAVSGRKFYTGPEATLGTQFGGICTDGRVFRHSASLQMFTAGATSATSLRFNYDSGDLFRIGGALVSFDQFKASLTANSTGAADALLINYSPGGTSEFNICLNAGASAPNDLSAAVGNFDGGAAGNDVRLRFTAPFTNMISQYDVERAFLGFGASSANCNLNATAPSGTDAGGVPGGSTFVFAGTATALAGQTATVLDLNLVNGGYCYRVRAQDPITAAPSYSNYVPINLPGAVDTFAPTSISAALTLSAGFSNVLDTGDRFVIDFSETMFIVANATIRFTDSDCGPATNAGPSACSGGQTNTISDVTCGVNAACTVSTSQMQLTVTLTANPAIVVAGSVPGTHLPLVVTDSSGVTDLSGNQWNLPGSPDRLIGGAGGGGGGLTSTSAVQATSAGFANTLDFGDRLVIDFSGAISVASNAVFRVTDSDCGPASNAGEAACSGGLTNTVADVICGTNATCTVQNGPAGPSTELAVLMVSNPSIVAAGNTAGAQFPVVITDSTGITDPLGVAWNIPASLDRLIP